MQNRTRSIDGDVQIAIRIVLIGNDDKFLQNISYYFSPFSTILNREMDRPAADWAFATRYCNSIILTAAASTFGFWMAYLSKNANIYYNYDLSQIDGIEKEFVRDDFFPPNWTPLLFDDDNETVSIATNDRIKVWEQMRKNITTISTAQTIFSSKVTLMNIKNRENITSLRQTTISTASTK